MEKKIIIKEYYPAYILTRNSINILKNRIDFANDNNSIIFDFSDIIFISRSFAHEFIKFAKKLKSDYKITNSSNNVEVMFKAVKKQSNKRQFSDIPVTTFKTQKELNSFFATI